MTPTTEYRVFLPTGTIPVLWDASHHATDFSVDVSFLLFERVSVIPHSACTFELDECRTFYLRVREACSLLTAAIQLGQDVTRVDQEVPGVGITEVTFFLLPMFKVIGDLRQLTAC